MSDGQILDPHGRYLGTQLVTLKVVYPYPDYPEVIAPPFVWQLEDLVPTFPRVRNFLAHWHNEIVVPIISCTLIHCALEEAVEFRFVDYESAALH